MVADGVVDLNSLVVHRFRIVQIGCMLVEIEHRIFILPRPISGNPFLWTTGQSKDESPSLCLKT